jgi:hypothetical protein
MRTIKKITREIWVDIFLKWKNDNTPVSNWRKYWLRKYYRLIDGKHHPFIFR